MRSRALIVLVLAIAGGIAGVAWWLTHRDRYSDELVLYGNVDLRQVDLAFNNSERISQVLVQEGDRVHAGQVVARLDISRLAPQVAQAEAMVAAQQAVVERMHNGSRPEEIAQARANVESAKADLTNARAQHERFQNLFGAQSGAVSKQDLDNAKAAFDVAEAKLVVQQRALDLALAGPRKEDVAQAEAQLRGQEAQLAFLRQQLKDCELFAPTDAAIRTRLMEPGDMASPTKAVFSLAIIDPKWVRAYASERDLAHVRPGMKASIAVDSFPDRRFEGWVGFVSPVAEFTPKAVQTPELRTSLVYEVRVFVNDAKDNLRLGMPATVYLTLNQQMPPTTEPAARTEP
jgi:HlyD family secretion protein